MLFRSDLNAATLDDVRTWYATHYGPNNCVLSLAGDITPDQALALVRKYFDGIKPGPPAERVERWIPRLDANLRERIEARVPQTRVYRVYHAPAWRDVDMDALDVAASVLSGSRSARLDRRLIYDEELATAVSAGAQTSEVAGLFIVDIAGNFIFGGLEILVVLVAFRIPGDGEATAGALNAAIGAGGFIGAIVAGVLVLHRRQALPLLAGAIIMGISCAGLGLAGAVPVAIVAMAFLSIGALLASIVVETLFQRIVPDEVRGRALGFAGTIRVIAMMAGSLVIPPLAGAIGVDIALYVSGAVIVLSTVVAVGLLGSHAVQSPAVDARIRRLAALPMMAGLPPARIEASMKLRSGEPWIPGSEYGRLLPAFTVNLVVPEIDRSVAFYRDVLQAEVHYADPDFAALRIAQVEVMLHADHTYEANPWHPRLVAGEPRGLGAELRLLGIDPDALEARARADGSLFKPVAVRGHGWREVMVRDPDGYVWAVGVLAAP